MTYKGLCTLYTRIFNNHYCKGVQSYLKWISSYKNQINVERSLKNYKLVSNMSTERIEYEISPIGPRFISSYYRSCYCSDFNCVLSVGCRIRMEYALETVNIPKH